MKPEIMDYVGTLEHGMRKVYGPCFLCKRTDDIVAYFVGRPSVTMPHAWANVCRRCRDGAEVIAQLMKAGL